MLEVGSLQAQKCVCHTTLWISQSQLPLNLLPEVHLLSFYHKYQISSMLVLLVLITHVNESFLLMLDLSNCQPLKFSQSHPGACIFVQTFQLKCLNIQHRPLMAASATPFLLSLQCIKYDIMHQSSPVPQHY